MSFFNLDHSIALWRRSRESNRAFTPDDLDELEQHLRDQVAEMVTLGVAEEEAFQKALHEMGEYGAAETEYYKVYWGKLARRREVWNELTVRIAMLKNYLKIAYRNVLRYKVYSIINVSGLAVGLAFCLLIFLYIRDELTYDQFHEDGNRIFRVLETSIDQNGVIQEGGNAEHPIPLGPALKEDVPGIEQYVRMQARSLLVRVQGEAVEEPVLFVDRPFLEVFSFPLRSGNPSTALSGIDGVVLSRTMARKYFGDQDPTGRILQVRLDQSFEDFTVTGVTEDPPSNSTIRFGVLAPFDRLRMFDSGFREMTDSWHYYGLSLFVSLSPGVDPSRVTSLMPAFFTKHHEEDIKRLRAEGKLDENMSQTYALQPIRDIHLTTDSKPLYSYILSGIGLAVLLIACINFMTLSIGHSVRRAREVGVRKVVGAGRLQLAGQFWGETLVLCGIALLLAVGLTYLFLPVFNQLASKSLHLNLARDWLLSLVLFGLVLCTGMLAGSYPAVLLSGLRPIETLANRLRLKGSNGFTKSLVVVQFALSVFLIASTFIMSQQMNYTRSKDLGFDTEQIVVVPTQGENGLNLVSRLRNQLKDQPNVVDITATGYTLGQKGSTGYGFRYEEKPRVINVFGVEANYLEFMGLDLVSGRNFDPRLATDSTRSIIVNETLVREFGLTDPIGKPIPGLPLGPDEGPPPQIIGVVKDHHFQALYTSMKPMMLQLDRSGGYRYLLVRIRPAGIPETIAVIKAAWKRLYPEIPFAYSFLDDDMQVEYRNDERWSQIIRYSALFAVLIAGLGLVGLATLTVSRRTKEIGIRKVLGASISRIVLLVSRDFILLVCVGAVLAIPAAWWAMNRWLEDFAYRIELSMVLFVLAGLFALTVALVMIGFNVVRAATANPVEALRYE